MSGGFSANLDVNQGLKDTKKGLHNFKERHNLKSEGDRLEGRLDNANEMVTKAYQENALDKSEATALLNDLKHQGERATKLARHSDYNLIATGEMAVRAKNIADIEKEAAKALSAKGGDQAVGRVDESLEAIENDGKNE